MTAKAQCSPKEHNGRQYFCAMELAIMMIGGKWKPLIIWRLAKEGTHRFGELRRILPSVTQKMLTQQLRELEADGLVARESFPQVPPRVEYSITERGRALLPILEQLNAWGRGIEEERGAGEQTAPNA